MNDISAGAMGRGIARLGVVGLWQVGIAAVALVLATLAMPARPASADATFNQRVLELVNRERTANGLRPLVADLTMGAVAEDAPYLGCGFPVAGRAKDMGQRTTSATPSWVALRASSTSSTRPASSTAARPRTSPG